MFRALYKSELVGMNMGLCETHDFPYFLMKKKNTTHTQNVPSFPGTEVCGISFPRTSCPSTKNRFHRCFFLWLLVPVALHRIASRLLIWWSWHVLIAGVCYRHCFISEKGTAVSHVTTTERRSSGFCFAFFFVACQLSILSCFAFKKPVKGGSEKQCGALFKSR